MMAKKKKEAMVSIHVLMPVWMRDGLDGASKSHRRNRTAEILTALDIYLMIVNEIDVCIVENAIAQAKRPGVVERVQEEVE